MSLENFETYINRDGHPMVRKCSNCVYWDNSKNIGEKSGLCTLKPIYFAFTLKPCVFPATKEFYLCENHIFKNEDKLSLICEKTALKNILNVDRNA
jgi:hypothetical protein